MKKSKQSYFLVVVYFAIYFLVAILSLSETVVAAIGTGNGKGSILSSWLVPQISRDPTLKKVYMLSRYLCQTCLGR